jgi:hypothetical protein
MSIPSQQELLDAINGAFPAEVFPWMDLGTYGEAEAFSAGTAGQTWCSLDLDFVLYFSEVIYFVNDDHFSLFLPAWLAHAVEYFDEEAQLADTLFLALCPERDGAPCERQLRRIASLSDEQRRVVSLALVHLQPRFRAANQRPRWRWVEEQDNTVTKLLNSHWARYL